MGFEHGDPVRAGLVEKLTQFRLTLFCRLFSAQAATQNTRQHATNQMSQTLAAFVGMFPAMTTIVPLALGILEDQDSSPLALHRAVRYNPAVMQTTGPKRSTAETLVLGCLWAIGIVVVFGVPGVLTKGHSDLGDACSAQLMCENHFVKDRLLSPSSAKFSPDAETKAVSLGDERWTVTGYVDSQNVYGAMLRSPYTCTVKYLGQDKWRQESVEIGKP